MSALLYQHAIAVEQKLRIAYTLYAGYLLRSGYDEMPQDVGSAKWKGLVWTGRVVLGMWGWGGGWGESDRHPSTRVIEKIMQGTK